MKPSWQPRMPKSKSAFDPVNGGFGTAPKFPQQPVLDYLISIAGKSWAPNAATMATHTLTKMAQGGIHDLVGGGFARYSVDSSWTVPHVREDALRQCPTGPPLPVGVGGVGSGRVRRRRSVDLRLHDAGPPPPGRRVLLVRGRRLRRRGGSLLCLGRRRVAQHRRGRRHEEFSSAFRSLPTSRGGRVLTASSLRQPDGWEVTRRALFEHRSSRVRPRRGRQDRHRLEWSRHQGVRRGRSGLGRSRASGGCQQVCVLCP